MPAGPAKLQPLDTDHFQIREGEAFELICGADGNPEPVITWSKLVSTRPAQTAPGTGHSLPLSSDGTESAGTPMAECRHSHDAQESAR